MSSGDRENLKHYYRLRAREYDRLYEKPDRQEDLGRMASDMVRLLEGRDVLEIACGTGYWTEILARHARKVHAIDASSEMLEIASRRLSGADNTTFSVDDVYTLGTVEEVYNAAFIGYFLSHVRRNEVRQFLMNINGKLEPGSPVVLFDNIYVDGANTPVSRTDDGGNTYQLRKLDNGEEYEIVKNFLTRGELEEFSRNVGVNPVYIGYSFYWLYAYYTK